MKKFLKGVGIFFLVLIGMAIIFGDNTPKAEQKKEAPASTKTTAQSDRDAFFATKQAILDDLKERVKLPIKAFPSIQIFGGTDQGPSSATLACRNPNKPLGTEFVMQGPGTVWHAFGIAGNNYRWVEMPSVPGGNGPSGLEQVLRNVARDKDSRMVVAFIVSDRHPSPNADAIVLNYDEVVRLNDQLRNSSCSGWYAPTWVNHTAEEVHHLKYEQ